MDGRIAPRRLCLIGALSLALVPVTPALGAPAGDEYLPAVPKADGKQGPPKNSGGGGGSSGSAAPAPASEDTGTAPSDSSSGATPAKEGSGKRQKIAKADATPNVPIAPVSTSSDDGSSGAIDTLLDPVVLLLIAGVAISAIGMTMRRRQAVAGDAGSEGATRELGSAPPTPDGEIIGREPPS